MEALDEPDFDDRSRGALHHWRIRLIGVFVLFAIAGFSVLALMWFFFKTGLCWGELPLQPFEWAPFATWDAVCRYSFVAPTFLGTLLILAAPLAFLALVLYGRDLEDGPVLGSPQDARADAIGFSGAPPIGAGQLSIALAGSAAALAHAPSRARLGFTRLRTPHKKHVRRTMLFAAAALGAFVGFAMFYEQLPALASLLVGVAPALAVLALIIVRSKDDGAETGPA